MVYLTQKAKMYLYVKLAGTWKYLRAAHDENGLKPRWAYMPKSTTPTVFEGGIYYAFDRSQWVRLSADPAEAWELYSTARVASQVATIKRKINPDADEDKNKVLTVSAAVAAMVQDYADRTKSKRKDRAKESSLLKVRATLGLFERHFGSNTLFKSLTREQVLNYIDNHKARGRDSRPATKQGMYVYLSRLFAFHEHQIFKKGDRPAIAELPPVREYSDAEISALMVVSDEYHALVWETLKWTGLRKMELLTLYKTDVKYDEVGEVYYLAITEKTELGWTTKTYHNREVVIPDDLGKRLLKYNRVPSSPLLFPSKGGKVNHDLIWQLKSRVKLAGLDPTTFKIHSFRSTMVTRALRNGMPIPDVKKHIGHSEKSNVIWRYAAAADKVKHRQMLSGMYGGTS